jgi:hypothetical protein
MMTRIAFVRSHPVATTVIVALVVLLVILVLLGVIGGRGGDEKGEALLALIG